MALDTSKIIHAPVGGGRYTVTSPIVKEDYGLYLLIEGLELPSTYEVDFSNSEHNGTSVTMIGNADGVLIPRQFITTGKDVFAFLYHVGADYGRTVFKFRIPNKLRPDRTNEQPTPEEQSVIDQAISALNSAVEQTAQDVASAHGYAQASASNAESASASAQSADASREAADESEYNAQVYAENAQASATASAQSASQSAQIKTDVESMVDDAQVSADASAQSASASANSAGQAQGYAQSASVSAQSASGYASSAQTSAQTATAKASEASTSASTASTKATESAQSASQALTYKTDAESAKTASQTAQGLAESARDSAISAKTDAESAKADAESARDEAQQAVASISGALADKAPVITDTASGAIASFSDGANDMPLKSLIVDINPIQDFSNGDPSPENICPISGWTEVDVEQSGVNLFDGNSFVSGRYDNADFSISSASSTRSAKIYLKAGTYTLSADATSSINRRIMNGAMSSAIRNLPMTFTLSADGWFGFSTTDLTNSFKLELGSTATPYEPYTGRSITINLGQTVYGGKLDVMSGELVINRAKVVVNGNSNIFGWATPIHPLYGFALNPLPRPDRSRGEVMCDKLSSRIGVSPWNVYRVNGTLYFCINDEVLSEPSLTGAKMWLADNPLTVVYPLAEPIEIQLFPNQVNSLLGVNNIWADSGDTEVEYRADTKLFIERLTAPDSADMIADANIQSGKYFMVGNSLYKATANIASGSAVIVGTNATRKSLSEALNEINA